MAYTVIARKYRPMIFEDIIGQEHVSTTLMNALRQNRVAHAYIFAGPRGVGKTTSARILAKAVNCEKQPAVNPCNECESCRSITDGSSMDVIEIDGASNRGIDEVRNIRDSIRFAPAYAKYKIYIIDEVHMLTRDAFNALLKTLEEPPSHAMFIFATTEIHKVPLTILSRCQRYDFKRIKTTEIQAQLKKICKQENVSIHDKALFQIARKADGSMRDSQSLLDQILSFSTGEITEEAVSGLLGLIDEDLFFSLTDIIHKADTPALVTRLHEIIATGHDLNDFMLQFEEHLKNLLMVRTLNSTELLDVSDVSKDKYMQQQSWFSEEQLLQMLTILSDTEPRLKNTTMPQLLFEISFLKLLKIPKVSDINKILGFITAIRKMGGKLEISDEIEEKLRDVDKWNSLSRTEETNSVKEDAKTGDPAANEVDNSVETIRNRWEEFVKWIEREKNKANIKKLLATLYPYKIQNNELILAANEGMISSLMAGLINKDRTNINRWLGEYFHVKLNFRLEEMNFKEAGIDWIMMSPEQILNSLKEQNPDIRKLDDLFDLEAVETE